MIKFIGVWALSDLGGGDFLARKIYAIPECVVVEIGIRTPQIARIRQANSFTNYRVVGNFSASLISRILVFSGFAGEKTPISILDFTCRNNFSLILCTVIESNKNESHVIVCNQISAM